MASDDDYMAFLNKANREPSEGSEEQDVDGSNVADFKTKDAHVEVPEVLVQIAQDDEVLYVSDADEPFVPVALEWDETDKGLPDEEEFAELIGHPDPTKADVEIIDPYEWDPRGDYERVIDAVREASKGADVRIYRLGKAGVRAEYWVLSSLGTGKGATLVGLKALAVES